MADSTEVVAAMRDLNTSYTDFISNIQDNDAAKELMMTLGFDIDKGGLPEFLNQLMTNGVDHIDVDGTIHWKNDIQKETTEEQKLQKYQRVNRATNAVNSLKSQGKIDSGYNFNFQSTDISSINQQIIDIQKMLPSMFVDGKINMTMEGADKVQAIMSALIRQKQEVEKPAFLKVDMSNASTDVQNFQNRLNHLYDLTNKKYLIEMGYETGNIDEVNAEIESVVNNLLAYNKNALITLGVDVDASPEDIVAQIQEKINNGELEITTINGKVQLTPVSQEDVDAAVPETSKTIPVQIDPKEADMNVTVKYASDGSLTPLLQQRDMYVNVHYRGNPPGDGASVDGTAHAWGTAFAKGNWGTKDSGKALGGELGQELVVNKRATFCFTA